MKELWKLYRVFFSIGISAPLEGDMQCCPFFSAL